jgi:hypothetical protein
MGKVVGAVNRVDDPQVLFLLPATAIHLFAEHGVVGKIAMNELTDTLLCFHIRVGNEVVRLLTAHGDAIPVISGDNFATQTNCFAADLKFTHWKDELPVLVCLLDG